MVCVVRGEGCSPGRAACTALRAKTKRAMKQRRRFPQHIARESGAWVRKRTGSNMNHMKLCQVARLRHKHSLWMFGLKFHGFLSETTGANVDMRKSSSANSRNPADLHIIQQPFEILWANAQPPKRHKGGWNDLKLTMETMFVGFRSCKTGATVWGAKVLLNGTWVTCAKT